jgi:hypothetical protein
MISTDRRTLVGLLLRTKVGRLLLLALLLGLLFVLASTLASRRSASAQAPLATEAGRSGEPGGRDGDLPPSPTGINETLTLGQKYDSLISRYGGDLTSTKTDLEATRKELETLRASMKAERSAQEKEKQQLGDYLRQLKEGLSQASPPSPLPGGANSDPRTSTPAAPASGAGDSRGLHAIDLGPPAARKQDRGPRFVRIPAAAGGRATLLNGRRQGQ